MKNKWDKILLELSYRVSTGIPDLRNEQHLMKLWDILKEHNWSVDARVELLKNLNEKVDKVYVQGKGPGGVKIQVGPRGGRYYMGDKKTGKPAPSALQKGTSTKKVKKKKLSKAQQKEEDRIKKLNIEKRLSDAKTPQDKMKVITDVTSVEHARVYEGIYGPGGGAATYGETNGSEATNDFFSGNLTKFGEKPSKPTPKPEHTDRFNQGNQKTKREAYAQELGIDPYDDNDPKQKEMIVNELARRETWVDSKMEEHEGTKVQKDKFKTKKEKESQKDWLRTAFDTGRSTAEDIENDPDYGGILEGTTPQSMLMSKANQKLVRDTLTEEAKKCQFLSGKEKKKCQEHHEEQLKNFDEGMSDHDTGTIWYDKDGNVRFLNTSNKKTKSMKDPQWNSTAEARIPEVIKTMGELADSGDFPGMNEKEVAGVINKGQKEATEISVNAAESLMTGRGANIETTQGDSSGNGADSGGMSIVAKRLPAQVKYQNEDAYFEKAKTHKKTQAKLKELYPDTPEGEYSDEQVLIAIQEVNKSGEGSWGTHGKFLNKMGQMYNAVKERYDTLKERGLSDEEIHEQIAKESDGVYTAEELKQILESKNLQEAGKLNDDYKTAMERAHEKVVSAALEADEKYHEKNPPETNEITGEPENGPHVRGYVKSFMTGMHWDTYIDNLDGKKSINIGGYNLKPAEFRSCLAELSGYPEESNPPNKEWRKGLQEHLEKNLKIDSDTNAVNIRGKDGEKTNSLAEDTWRSAGDAKKIAGGLGDDLISCIKKKYSKRKSAQRKS